MFVSGNLDLNGRPYISRTADDFKNDRADLCLVDYLQAACFDSDNPIHRYFVEYWLKQSFAAALKNRQFSKAQQFAAIYGQLFGDGCDELFAQVAAARGARPSRG
jgi:hypothetical protein